MRYFMVDAFTDRAFGGNPAGVCLLDKALDAETMQCMAAQHNLSETAFVLQQGEGYSLRWFTPKVEIDLCGHATLASAFVITHFMEAGAQEVLFDTRSGRLPVKRQGDLFQLDFPSRSPQPTAVTGAMMRAFGLPVLEAAVYAKDLILIVDNEPQVRQAAPDFEAIKLLAGHAVSVTARGDTVDFVSRFFAPNVGVPEDPVTGSVHTMLIPFWAQRLGKSHMTARQLSPRGGDLICESCGDRVRISGRARLYLQGDIVI